jgi:anti-sigma factor RsiW
VFDIHPPKEIARLRNEMKIEVENLQEQCPGLEGLGAYVDGKLTSEEKAFIESHLAKCKHCRRVMELVIESKSEVPNTTPTDPCK